MEMIKSEKRLSAFEVWMAWFGGNFLAGVCALVLSFTLFRVAVVNDDRWGAAVLISALVLFLGAAQALVLSMRVRRSWWWIVVTAAGCAFSVIVFLLVAYLASKGLANSFGMGTSLTLAIYGACTGIVQWLFLRRLWAHAIWWIPASLIGWALPGILVAQMFTTPIQMALLAGIPAAVTGLLVAWWFSEKRDS